MPGLTPQLLAAKSTLESDRRSAYPEIARKASVSTATVRRAVERWPHLGRSIRRPILTSGSTLTESDVRDSEMGVLAGSLDRVIIAEDPPYGVFDADGSEPQPLNLMDHWPEAEPRESDRMELGNIVVTGGVGGWAQRSAERTEFLIGCLERHRIGDWGEVDDENRALNDELATEGKPVISCYQIPDSSLNGDDGHQVWNLLFVMTAAENPRGERIRTTLMWSHEY